MNPEWIGSLAAVLTTVSYIPQVVKVVRYRHTQSISLGMYSILTVGIGAWFVYGIMLSSPSLILANGITFVLAAFILMMKIKHG
jgi:MtN3 and saliva related transmembrane protein